MVGTLPKTRYLLTRYGVVKGDFQNKYEVGVYLGASINEEGSVHFLGKKMGPSYFVKGSKAEKTCSISNNAFTLEEALRDWCYHHMNLPSEYSLYRYLVNA
jgi:hypothetical protein